MISNIKNLQEYFKTFGTKDECKLLYQLYKIAASKKKILIEKVGLSERLATPLDELFGARSVFIANKIIDFMDPEEDETKVEMLNHMSWRTINAIFDLESINDYILVALNGDISTIKPLSIIDIKYVAKEWHDSLEASSFEVNYVENNEIVLDFRDKRGIGFYWVDLGTNYSKEEASRMGHCGNASYGNTLFSLREYSLADNKKYTLNESHLTFAVNDGIITQAKGKRNSKPSSSYHEYIVKFLSLKSNEGNLFSGFKSEYDGKTDFNISDLDEEMKFKLLNENEQLFYNTYAGLKYLLSNGKITEERFLDKLTFRFEITEQNCDDYFSWSRQYGSDTLKNVFESAFSDFLNYIDDFSTTLRYFTEQDKTLIRNKCYEVLSNNGIDINKNDYKSKNLHNIILDADKFASISNAIQQAYADASLTASFNAMQNIINNAVKDGFGSDFKSEFYPDSFSIKVNFILNNQMDEPTIDKILSGEELEAEGLFEFIEKPHLRLEALDDVSYDDQEFSQNLIDNLNNLEQF